MTIIKMFFLLFILVGLGLIGKSGYELVSTYLRLTHPDTIYKKGIVKGYYTKVSQYTDSRGNFKTGTWFPQAIVLVDGEKITDPGYQAFEYFKREQVVQIAYLPIGHALNFSIRPIVLIDHIVTRYAFYSVVLIIGLMFFIFPLLIWPSLNSQVLVINELMSKPIVIYGLTFSLSKIIYTFIGILILGAMIGLKEHIYQLLPTGNRKDVSKIIIEGNHIAFKNILNDIKPNQQTTHTQFTPLMEALYYNRHEMARILVEQEGLDIRSEDSVKRNLLFFAVRFNNEYVVKRLLAKGASIKCSYENTLHTAIALKNLDIIKSLLQYVPPLNEIDPQYKKSAGDLAILAKLPEIVILIKEKNGLFTAPSIFVETALKGKEALDSFVSSGGSMDVKFGNVSLKEWIRILKI